jgi:hypothetical protein
LSTVQHQTANVVNGNIHRPISLCWLFVRLPGEQDGSSRAELLSCLEDYKNGYYFFCVIPIKKIETIYGTSQFNNTGAINKSILLALDIKFRASKEHPEFKVAIM